MLPAGCVRTWAFPGCAPVTAGETNPRTTSTGSNGGAEGWIYAACGSNTPP